jgi:hypothetical protein
MPVLGFAVWPKVTIVANDTAVSSILFICMQWVEVGLFFYASKYFLMISEACPAGSFSDLGLFFGYHVE